MYVIDVVIYVKCFTSIKQATPQGRALWTCRFQGPTKLMQSGVDPGFLERGLICIKVGGGVGLLCPFYPFFLKYPMKIK